MFSAKQNKKVFIGKLGEELSGYYLSGNKKYKLLFKNIRTPYGEVDIFCFDNQKNEGVFVEVKTMLIKNKNYFINPEDHLNEYKINKMKDNAYYLANDKFYESCKNGWRIEAVSIKIPEFILDYDFSKKEEIIRLCEIKHYENL